MWCCVTVAVIGGIDVIMACWNACRLSDSLSPPMCIVRAAFGDQRTPSVVARPVIREGLDECLVVVVIGGEGVYEVGDGGLCV